MARPSLLSRPRAEQVGLALAGLALVTALALAASYAASGARITPPGGAGQGVSTSWGVVAIALVFAVWPVLGMAAILRRKGILLALACGAYLVQAVLMGFSLGGPHLISGVPLLLIGAALYAWSRRRSANTMAGA